jgi:hypothetical protein
MRAKKTSWDKTAIFLSVWRQNKNKNNQRTKLSIYILDTIESESTTRFKNPMIGTPLICCTSQHLFHVYVYDEGITCKVSKCDREFKNG